MIGAKGLELFTHGTPRKRGNCMEGHIRKQQGGSGNQVASAAEGSTRSNYEAALSEDIPHQVGQGR